MIVADPDAIASAMAIRRLLWRKVISVTIAHVNIIERPDNLAMIRLLGVNLIHFDTIDKSAYNRIVIVDSQPSHHEAWTGLEPDVIIDHHPDTGAKAAFADIRPQYGATATILTEYLRAARIKPAVKLATGLFHGIKTDTHNFARQAQSEDVRAFQFLFRHTNINLAWKIEHAELQIGFLKYFQVALKSMHLRKGRIFTHLGNVSNPDICVILADFFMRIDAVTWSIVSGIYQRRLILIFRNDGLRRNAGRVAKQSFGTMGPAGGHKSMARAEIASRDLKGHVDFRDNAALLTWIIKSVEKKAGKK